MKKADKMPAFFNDYKFKIYSTVTDLAKFRG